MGVLVRYAMTGKDVLKFELRDTPAGPSASSTETPGTRCIYSVESLRVYIWEEARVAQYISG